MQDYESLRRHCEAFGSHCELSRSHCAVIAQSLRRARARLVALSVAMVRKLACCCIAAGCARQCPCVVVLAIPSAGLAARRHRLGSRASWQHSWGDVHQGGGVARPSPSPYVCLASGVGAAPPSERHLPSDGEAAERPGCLGRRITATTFGSSTRSWRWWHPQRQLRCLPQECHAAGERRHQGGNGWHWRALWCATRIGSSGWMHTWRRFNASRAMGCFEYCEGGRDQDIDGKRKRERRQHFKRVEQESSLKKVHIKGLALWVRVDQGRRSDRQRGRRHGWRPRLVTTR